MSDPIPTPAKDSVAIAAEWDAVAGPRHEQLKSHVDVSFDRVLAPTVLRLLDGALAGAKVLDVGSGTGVLTAMLAADADRVVGVDPSPQSVQYATKFAEDQALSGHVGFHVATIEQFGAQCTEKFDCIVANMTLMDVPDLQRALNAMAAVASPEAVLVWTITHPWFWPRYWRYDQLTWFRYNEEIFIESEFKISRSTTGLPTTHVHRPLSQYMKALAGAGFVTELMEEPMPSAEVIPEYPQPWDFPRFLAGRARHARETR